MELQHAHFAIQGLLSTAVMTALALVCIARGALCPDTQVNLFI